MNTTSETYEAHYCRSAWKLGAQLGPISLPPRAGALRMARIAAEEGRSPEFADEIAGIAAGVQRRSNEGCAELLTWGL